jgi:hypothetical protein
VEPQHSNTEGDSTEVSPQQARTTTFVVEPVNRNKKE